MGDRLDAQAAALGMAYGLDGRIAAGLALVEQGVEQTVARGNPRSLATVVAWLSEAYLLADRLEEAHTRAAQALALAEELDMRPLQAHCHHGLGTLYARQGQQDQTSTALSTAIELYRAMDAFDRHHVPGIRLEIDRLLRAKDFPIKDSP